MQNLKRRKHLFATVALTHAHSVGDNDLPRTEQRADANVEHRSEQRADANAEHRSEQRAASSVEHRAETMASGQLDPSPRPFATGFVAYDVALDLLRALAPIVEQLRGYNADIADQIVRAGTSIVLNLAEGSGRRGQDRKRFFRMAHGSGREIMGALDTANAWGWRIDARAAWMLLDRELRLLWGLCR